MKELRLMNKDVIDSLIRTDEGMKHLVIDGEVVCSAPIMFDLDKYREIEAIEIIHDLMEHLYQKGTYMDDLNDEMILELINQNT